ncbi:MAG: hypothetical protein K2K79_02590 [Paramuribaculum sp.]|nr:hypothetical protein [Paramuribaculum sp.]
MTIRTYILALLMMLTLHAGAQELDTLSAGSGVAAPTPSYLIPHPEMQQSTLSPIFDERSLSPALRLSESPIHSTFMLDNTGLFGPLSGFSGQAVYPGMMDVRSAYLNLSASIGKLDLNLWGEASQIGAFRSYYRHFGVGMSARINFTDRLSMTLFGTYYTPLRGLQPAMAGFFTTSRAGGYLSYDLSDHWGVSVGAQTVRSDFDNRWRMQPIVMPYYRLNKHVTVEVDLGGVLYNAFIDNGSRNPTIAPPRR